MYVRVERYILQYSRHLPRSLTKTPPSPTIGNRHLMGSQWGLNKRLLNDAAVCYIDFNLPTYLACGLHSPFLHLTLFLGELSLCPSAHASLSTDPLGKGDFLTSSCTSSMVSWASWSLPPVLRTANIFMFGSRMGGQDWAPWYERRLRRSSSNCC